MVEIDNDFKKDEISAYTEHGQVKYDRSTMKPLGHGKYGEVYDMGDGQVLKRFFDKKHVSYSGASGTARVIKTIKNLKLENIYAIREILYKGKYKLNRDFIGYVMTKYEPTEIDFTQVDINYLINNYQSIKRDFIQLANKNIIVRDLHSNNVIVTQDKIIIIDVDNYTKDPFGPKSLGESINISGLNSLFIKLLVESYFKFHYDDENCIRKRNYLNENFRQFPNMIEELKGYSTFDEYLNNKLGLTKSHSM